MADNPLKSLTHYSRFVHKHLPPDIKHHRIPASEMSFTQPNLPVLVREIEGLAET
jgi:hypothetical protein